MGSFEKNIKICYVTREYAHSNMGKTGGIGVFLKQFTEQLKKYNFEITVFSFGAVSTRFDDNGVHIVKIKDLSLFNEWLKAPLRRNRIPGYITFKIILEYINRIYISMYLSVFVRRKGIDIIEFHDYGGDAPFLISCLPKIIRCHGSAVTLHEFMGYDERVPDTLFERIAFRRFNANVIAVSEYSAQITKRAFKLKRNPTVIYNGVEISNKTIRFKDNYFDDPTVPKSIFYFGSIRERKGIDIACKVFNSLVEQFSDATFHVMGNNNNDYWNTHAVHLLSDLASSRTTYHGAIPNNEISEYLKQAHVVIFPSFGENFSIALLEVMSMGKIAITSDIPAFNEIIENGHNGHIASSQEDYINLITQLFESKNRIDFISNNAVDTINKEFTLDKKIKENIDYYNSLL